MRLDLVEGVEDVRPLSYVRRLQETISRPRRRAERYEIVDRLAQAHVDGCQRDVSAVAVGHDIELLAGRELVILDVGGKCLGGSEPSLVIVLS